MDDIILFIRAIPSNAAKLVRVLRLYQESSGQVFNISKSLIFFGKSNLRSISKIKTIFKFKYVSLPCRYLGVPLFIGCPQKTHFQDLLSMISKKLVGWKSQSLSFAGILVLLRHVLGSMPLHITMMLPLPKSICYSIEKLLRNFLWFGNDNQQRMHYVSWKKICLPKEDGGLGVRYISEVNEACIFKLRWRTLPSNNLWSTWFRSRFMNGCLHHVVYFSSLFGSCISLPFNKERNG